MRLHELDRAAAPPYVSLWQQADSVLIKSTGFPYELLEALRDDRLAPLMSEGTEADIRAVIDDNVRALLRVADTPRMREAVMLSSPSAFDEVEKVLDRRTDPADMRTKDRQRLRTLVMYVQRLCAKNESTSFFGPTYWARLGAGPGLDVDTTGGDPRCEVFWSHWAVGALAERMAADAEVAPHLVPRRPPTLVRDESGARRVRFVHHPMTVEKLTEPAPGSVADRLLVLCDGERTAADCASALGQPASEVVALLRELRETGLVEFDLTPPMGTTHPFAELRGFTGGLPAGPRDRWLTVLDGLDERRLGFANATGVRARAKALAEVKSRFQAETALAADRHHGEIAVDRTILMEDGVHDWARFDIGGPLERYLRERLPPIIDLTFELSLARRRARARETEQWFRDHFGAGRAVPLDRALAVAEETDLASRLRAIDDEVWRTGPSAISDVLLADPGRERVHRDLTWAHEQAARMDFDTWCVCGVDLLVATGSTADVARDRFELVVGEIHGLHDQLVQGLWPRLHPDPAQLAANVGGIVAGISDATICDPTLPHQRKTMARLDALPEIEFSGRSPRPPHRRARAADLWIREEDGRLVLHAEPLGSIALTRPPLWWWSEEPDTLFAPFTGARLAHMEETIRLCEDVDHVPRLTIDRAVVRRETWWLPPARQAKWTNLAPGNQVEAWRCKDRLGLPDQIFLKIEEEPKPVFVDFHVPVLVEMFARCLHRTAKPAVVTEMLPGPDELWLRDERGRYTCELRFGYYRPAATKPEAPPW